MQFVIHSDKVKTKSPSTTPTDKKAKAFGKLANTALQLSGSNGSTAAVSFSKPAFGANGNGSTNAQLNLKKFLG